MSSLSQCLIRMTSVININIKDNPEAEANIWILFRIITVGEAGVVSAVTSVNYAVKCLRSFQSDLKTRCYDLCWILPEFKISQTLFFGPLKFLENNWAKLYFFCGTEYEKARQIKEIRKICMRKKGCRRFINSSVVLNHKSASKILNWNNYSHLPAKWW